jgi:UDP-2-acetamido-3-amino-2,3-dideoxy-glucuronate N-acetyltransferase
MKTHESPHPRIAVVGCGHWGKNLTRVMSELGALAAVVDRSDQVAAAMAEKFQVPVRSLGQVLADASIDGIVIATPAVQHHDIAHEALLAGKHVFVEKPLALKVAEAEDLVRLAAAQTRVLMVGHLLRYHPAFLELLRLRRQGQLGHIRYAYSHRLNLGKFRTEENSLWSFAPHDVSMILALMEAEPITVSAFGHCYLTRSVADVTTTHMAFPNGEAAHIHVSWLHPFKEQRLVVVGDGGMAVFDDGLGWENKLRIYPAQIAWREGLPFPDPAEARPVPLDPSEPLRFECQHFLDCVSGRARPVTDGAEGLAVLRVLDAAQRSMESGLAVSLNHTAGAKSGPTIHSSAVIDNPCVIGEGTRIWHHSHILADSTIGRDCVIGQNVSIGPKVSIGDRCKIQNNVSVYAGVTLEDGVFCGPSMVFTNVMNPRAEISRAHEFRPTLVRRGASIGANATIICGRTIGRWAFVGAGSVVSRDVPDYALVVGNPARIKGWVCRCGERLPAGTWTEAACPACGLAYHRDGDHVTAADDEGK